MQVGPSSLLSATALSFTAACTMRSATAGDRQRPLLSRPGLGDKHPTCQLRLVAAILETGGELAEQPVNTEQLDLLNGHLVDTGCATVAAHQLPRTLQHVPTGDLVIQRVEPSPGIVWVPETRPQVLSCEFALRPAFWMRAS